MKGLMNICPPAGNESGGTLALSQLEAMFQLPVLLNQ
jgi:hypothetical protein